MNWLLLSYIILATSAKAYERLIEEQVLMLPSVKTLRKITMNVDKTAGLDDSDYLHMSFSKLNPILLNGRASEARPLQKRL